MKVRRTTPKTPTIFTEKPDLMEAFRKPVDQVEPPKYIRARTINIIPEASPYQRHIKGDRKSKSKSRSKKGDHDEESGEEKITMLRYDRKFEDMLPVNAKKVNQIYPDLMPRKQHRRPPF